MRRHLTVTMIAVLAIMLAGCDLSGEEVAEQADEQVTETDVDDDAVSVEDEEGASSSDAEGETETETDHGTVQSQGGELAEGFPSGIPVPDGGTLEIGESDDDTWFVQWQFDAGDPDELLEALTQALDEAGFVAGASMDFGDATEAVFVGDEYRVDLEVRGETDDFTVRYRVFERSEEE